jgi:hypothetical protein
VTVKVQDGYTITPPSPLGKAPQPVAAMIDPTVDMKRVTAQPILLFD